MSKITENRATKNKALVGEKFGRLTVVELLKEKDAHGYFKCRCKCDCGNEIITVVSRVKLGRTQSCGCTRKGIRKYSDLAGRKFGKLTAIKRVRFEAEKTYWLCRCDCGNEKEIRTDSLKEGSIKSCGCASDENLKLYQPIAVNVGRYEGTKIHLISNCKLNRNNTSGVKGVSWNKKGRKWSATIGLKGKNIHLGTYDNKEDAIKARKEAEEKYFKPIIEKYNNTED